MQKSISTPHQLLREAGFSSRGNLFLRIKNDLLQNVEIRHVRIRKEYIVTFGIIPLCAAIQTPLHGCLYDLASFDSSTFNNGWQYTTAGNDKMRCLTLIGHSVQQYLLPFFQQADSCAHGFPVLQATLKHFESVRQVWLHRNYVADADHDESFESCLLGNSCLFYMALKNENYDFALRSLNLNLEQLTDSYRRNQKSHGSEMALQEIKKMMDMINVQIDCIQQKKYEVIRRELIRNEEKSIKYLSSFF